MENKKYYWCPSCGNKLEYNMFCHFCCSTWATLPRVEDIQEPKKDANYFIDQAKKHMSDRASSYDNEWNKKMEDNGKEGYIKILEDFIQKLRSDEVTDFEIESSNPPQMMFSHEHRDFIRVPSENHSIDIRYILKKKEVKGLFKCPECKNNLDEQMFCSKCCSKWTKSEPGKEKIEEAEIEWSDIDSITNLPKSSKQLAEEHWEYIEALLKAHEEEYNIKQIEFHYKSAFIHGYKHAMEEK